MRIIKEVKIEEKEFKKTCYNCKTKFTYTKSDTEIDKDGKYVICPSCRKFISVT